MFGPFRATRSALGGLLWKIPHTMSRPQKARHRLRMKTVDNVIETLSEGLKSKGMSCHAVVRAQTELPKEKDMKPQDKYFIFSKSAKHYRKGAHRK